MENMNYLSTDGLTRVDVRDAFASKKYLIELSMYLQNFGRKSMDSKRQSLDRKSDRQSSCVHFEPDPRVKIQEKLDFGITWIYNCIIDNLTSTTILPSTRLEGLKVCILSPTLTWYRLT